MNSPPNPTPAPRSRPHAPRRESEPVKAVVQNCRPCLAQRAWIRRNIFLAFGHANVRNANAIPLGIAKEKAVAGQSVREDVNALEVYAGLLQIAPVAALIQLPPCDHEQRSAD